MLNKWKPANVREIFVSGLFYMRLVAILNIQTNIIGEQAMCLKIRLSPE